MLHLDWRHRLKFKCCVLEFMDILQDLLQNFLNFIIALNSFRNTLDFDLTINVAFS